jgi:nitrite reductase (NO-forming)
MYNSMKSAATTKRGAISRRSVLVAIPAVGLAGACATDDPLVGDQTVSAPAVAAGGGDTAVVAVEQFPREQSIIPALVPRVSLPMADADEVHATYAPNCPPPIARTEPRIFDVDLEVLEGMCALDPANSVSTLMWGYRIAGDSSVTCGTPGPTIRGRVGDVMRVTMTNLTGNEHPHNIDFHAVTGQGGGAADLTAAPGESVTIEGRLLYPGAFMYHCAFGDVPEHIVHGMYGMVIVDPETPLPPVDHEWSISQSEWYVGEPDEAGVAGLDRDSLNSETPRYITFNGRVDALDGDSSLRMQVGERARIYFVNQGLNLDSNFHPIGSHWDTVYPEAATHPANRVIRGSQSTLVVAGGGTVTELIGQVPSTLILVDHALVRTFYKGAIGLVVIEGDPNPEIFSVGESDVGIAPVAPDPGEAVGTAEPVATNEITIPSGAWDPANAAAAYSPPAVVVSAGTIVTWTSEDTVVHTVTSGTSNGQVGTPDGLFDSGLLAIGEDFSITFAEPGEYRYYCTPHPWMQGRVVVQ